MKLEVSDFKIVAFFGVTSDVYLAVHSGVWPKVFNPGRTEGILVIPFCSCEKMDWDGVGTLKSIYIGNEEEKGKKERKMKKEKSERKEEVEK